LTDPHLLWLPPRLIDVFEQETKQLRSETAPDHIAQKADHSSRPMTQTRRKTQLANRRDRGENSARAA